MLKRSAEMAKLRQTCSLGLPSTVLVPRILEELHGIVSCDRMHFAWCDRLGNIVNGYFEKPDPAALDYFKNNFDRFLAESGLALRQALLFGAPTGNARWPYKSGFENTQSHRALFQNLGLHFVLDGVIRDAYGPLGMLFLLRRAGDPDFSASDEAYLLQALPYIAHALAHQGVSAESFIESGDSALMVFDHRGALTFQSVRARELCYYALSGQEDAVKWDANHDLREMKVALGRLFEDSRQALKTPLADSSPPAWNISNRWGEFKVRSYELRESADKPPSVGVLLEQMVPLEVFLLQRIKDLPLSMKQREVCYLLVRGVPTKDMAAMLNIAATTLKEHTQQIYRKLGIRRKDELIRFVMPRK
ncbi:MAG: helix-turn-helix transcriptional regulator [Propionivibrio sp.]